MSLTSFGKFSALFLVFLWVYTIATEIINIVKLVKLILDPNLDLYTNAGTKHLAIHLLGLVPGFCWVTAWF